MKARIVSFVSVGSNTCVRLAETESERFFPLIWDGYGSWRSPFLHHRPIAKGCVSRWML